jgi:SAM-dependent methyltransferase
MDFTRYLASKKTVDDRALNRYVWLRLSAELESLADKACAPRVLEIGAGIGTMIERVVEWGLLRRADYTAIDARPDNIQEAARRLSRWASTRQLQVAPPPEDNQTTVLQFSRTDGLDLRLSLEAVDLFDFVGRDTEQGQYDLLIAHAVLDLLDLPSALPQILRVLKPGGVCYFTINFDGATIFQPEIDRAYDSLIEELYHKTMDERLVAGQASGDSHTGRHLFTQLPAAGVNILAAGSSDWVVYAQDGRYPNDEAYFLAFILHTLQHALDGHPRLDRRQFAGWLAQRREQLANGTLVYIAHQLDFLGKLR